jgi:hypothetical protein
MRRFLLALAFLCLTAACSSGERPYLTDPADTTTSTVPEDDLGTDNTDAPAADPDTGTADTSTTVSVPERLDPNDPDYPKIPPATSVTYPSS